MHFQFSEIGLNKALEFLEKLSPKIIFDDDKETFLNYLN